MSGFRYYRKRVMFNRYIHAAAEPHGGKLTAAQVVFHTSEFERLWRNFVREQKERFKYFRNLERVAHARGEPMPQHDYKGNGASDVQYWDDACARAQRREV